MYAYVCVCVFVCVLAQTDPVSAKELFVQITNDHTSEVIQFFVWIRSRLLTVPCYGWCSSERQLDRVVGVSRCVDHRILTNHTHAHTHARAHTRVATYAHLQIHPKRGLLLTATGNGYIKVCALSNSIMTRVPMYSRVL